MAQAAAFIPMILQGGGNVLQAYGAYQEGQFGKELSNYNAHVANLRAEDALARGKERESLLRQAVRSRQGLQKAIFAAGNQDISSGSAAAVIADTGALGEMDALTIQNNAIREAWGFKVEAEQEKFRGKVAEYTGNLKAFGSLLSGGGQAAKSYAALKS